LDKRDDIEKDANTIRRKQNKKKPLSLSLHQRLLWEDRKRDNSKKETAIRTKQENDAFPKIQQ